MTNEEHELLFRIDERTKSTADTIREIKQEIRDIRKNQSEQYVSRAEWEPVKRMVYGLASLILIAVIGAMIVQVVQ